MDQHTITVEQRASETLGAMFERVRQSIVSLDTPPQSIIDGTEAEQQAWLNSKPQRQTQVIDQQWSLLRGLQSFLVNNRHDQNVELFRDGDLSLFFTYTSGYHGGLIFHDRQGEPAAGTWSIHT